MSEREYFVISVKHNQRSDRYIILWGPNNSGYLALLESAGRYPESMIRADLRYYNTGNNDIAVPCELIEQLSVPVEKGFSDTDDGHWVLNNRHNWQTIMKNVIEKPKYKPKPEYRSARRRGGEMREQITIPPEFYQIGKNLREQDNRCTDQPMFVVFQKREIIGSDEHSPSRIVWVLDGEEVEELRSKRLELLYHDGRDTSRYDRYAMQEIDVFVTACFTEQGCKDYLQRNGHNLRQPFIYAAGSYRNNEYQEVRKWLMSLPEGGDHV